jgi:hypothetical protein
MTFRKSSDFLENRSKHYILFIYSDEALKTACPDFTDNVVGICHTLADGEGI